MEHAFFVKMLGFPGLMKVFEYLIFFWENLFLGTIYALFFHVNGVKVVGKNQF